MTRAGALLFALAALVYAVTAPGHMQTGDNRAELAVAESIVARGDFTVGPAPPFVFIPYVSSTDGVPYASYGIGASIVLLPAALIGTLADCPGHGCPASVQHATDFAASFVGAFFAALAVTVLFLFALDLGAGIKSAVALALLFAFATIEWAYAHDAYDIGPASALALLALFTLHRGLQRNHGGWIVASGCAMGFAVLTRLPIAVFLPVFGGYLLISVTLVGARAQLWREAVTYVLEWGAPIALSLAVMGWYNWSRFGSPLNGGQGGNGEIAFSTPLLTGLMGQLVSPGKSLLLFSPPLLIGVAALPAFMRRHVGLGLVILSAAAINLVFFGRYYEWAGDYAWGPRYTVPLTGLLLLPAISLLSTWRRQPLVARVGLIVTGAAGVAVQILGVSIDYLHQMLLERFQGIDPRTYWSIQYSAVWRHALAFWQVLHGSAPYPTDQTPMDLTLGLPQFTTIDFWWIYAWINGISRVVIVTIVGGAVLLILILAYRLFLATREAATAPSALA